MYCNFFSHFVLDVLSKFFPFLLLFFLSREYVTLRKRTVALELPLRHENRRLKDCTVLPFKFEESLDERSFKFVSDKRRISLRGPTTNYDLSPWSRPQPVPAPKSEFAWDQNICLFWTVLSPIPSDRKLSTVIKKLLNTWNFNWTFPRRVAYFPSQELIPRILERFKGKVTKELDLFQV